MRTFARGRLLLLAAVLVGACTSNTGLAIPPSTSGSAGAFAMGSAGAGATGSAGSTSGDAGGATFGISDGGPDDTGEDDTLPVGWTGARALVIRQSSCPNGESAPLHPPFNVTEVGRSVQAELDCVEFREFQLLCGYVIDSGPTTRVLIEPCDLHPKSVPKGDEVYDVNFMLAARADRTAIEVYRRFDDYGAPPPNAPVLAATALIGAADGGQTSADGGAD